MPSPNLKSAANLKYRSLLVLGSLVIFGTMSGLTWLLYHNGIENEVLTSNYQSSILLVSSVKTGTGAAPYALLGLNWFVCRSGLKKWRKWLKKQFAK